MRNTSRIPAVLSLALVSGGLSTGIAFWLGGTPKAQTSETPPSAAAPGSVAVTDVPFYAEWAGSPHARRTAEAFTYWNKAGAIPVECAKCHSTPGFHDFLGADGSSPGVVDRPAAIGTVITCGACHNSKTQALTSVVFPSGAKAENLGADARCMACHQGRTSRNTVDSAVGGQEDDTANPRLAFLNIHYRAAGATLMGTMARGAYEYPGKTYAGRFQHREPYNRCTTCHDPHAAAVQVADCGGCHKEVTNKASLHRIRTSRIDYDGNGDVNEGIAQEVETLRNRLYAAITAYAKSVAKKDIVYDSHAHPYFYGDTNGDGKPDKDEVQPANRYNAWTPRLLKAAYNYQFVTKDPGAYAHNPTYTLQILYDSLADLGAKTSVDLARAKRP
jgi:hypothetical protein